MSAARERTQLLLARRLWQRPWSGTADAVERAARKALEEGRLTRDEHEVVEILIELFRRGAR